MNMTRMRLLAMSAEEAQAFIQFQVQNADVSHVLWFAENHWVPSRPIEEMMIEELKRSLAWIGEATGGTKEALQARLRAATGKVPEVPAPENPESTAAKRTVSGTEKPRVAVPQENSQRSPVPKQVFSFGAQPPRPTSPIHRNEPINVPGDESPVRRAREKVRDRDRARGVEINELADY